MNQVGRDPLARNNLAGPVPTPLLDAKENFLCFMRDPVGTMI